MGGPTKQGPCSYCGEIGILYSVTNRLCHKHYRMSLRGRLVKDADGVWSETRMPPRPQPEVAKPTKVRKWYPKERGFIDDVVTAAGESLGLKEPPPHLFHMD